MELLSEKEEVDFMDENLYEDAGEDYYDDYQDDDNNRTVYALARSRLQYQPSESRFQSNPRVGHLKGRSTSGSGRRAKTIVTPSTHQPMPQSGEVPRLTSGAPRPNKLPLLTITSSSDTAMDNVARLLAHSGHSGVGRSAAGEMNEAYVTMDTPAALVAADDSRNGYGHHQNYLDVPLASLNILPELGFGDSASSATEMVTMNNARRLPSPRHSKQPVTARADTIR
jgi:hypothetical protein